MVVSVEHTSNSKRSLTGALPISVVILTFNEERCIRRAIDSVIDDFSEVIVIDSGSTDSTLSIVSSYNDKVNLYTIEWQDDFSLARNFGISKVTQEWVFMMDADEYVSQIDKGSVNRLTKKINRTLFCPEIINIDDGPITNNPRLFEKNAENEYRGLVHEYIPLKGRRQTSINIKLEHDGYQEKIYKEKGKRERNLRLLTSQINDDKGNIRWYYYLSLHFKRGSSVWNRIVESVSKLNLDFNVEYEVFFKYFMVAEIDILIVNCDFHCAQNKLLQLIENYDSLELWVRLIYCDYFISGRESIFDESIISEVMKKESDKYLDLFLDITTLKYLVARASGLALV
jgi:glycosyltransferase involved in cell wall biosynthesis